METLQKDETLTISELLDCISKATVYNNSTVRLAYGSQ